MFHFIKKEIEYFKRLSDSNQKLFISTVYYGLAWLLFTTFTTAFLWRNNQNFSTIAVYHIALFAGLPTGFYINAHLLKKIKLSHILIFGSILQGVSTYLLSLVNPHGLITLFFFGLVMGLAYGLYWGNRNYLDQIVTESQTRDYYKSLVSSVRSVIGIFVPILTGWLIVLGEKVSFYTPNQAYQLLFLLSIIVLLISGRIIHNLGFVNPVIKNYTLFDCQTSLSWWQQRFLNYFGGIASSINFYLSSMIVLFLIGNEGVLGTVNTVAVLFTSLAIYIIGKKIASHQRAYILNFAIIIFIFGALLEAFSINLFSVIIYFIAVNIYNQFFWSVFDPLSWDLIDHESKHFDHSKYAYVFDRELWLNMGRITTVLVLLISLVFFPMTVSIKITLFIICLFQLAAIWVVKNLKVSEVK